MATTFPTYPATTFEQAVELAIFSSNQLHNIINADATSFVETENGSIPSVRAALVENLYFKTPAIVWEEGLSVTVFNQLYTFSSGTTGTALWYAPTATTSNPIVTGTSPEDDSNWKLYGWDTYSKTELNSTSGASYIGTSNGSTVQDELDNIEINFIISEIARDNGITDSQVQIISESSAISGDALILYDNISQLTFFRGSASGTPSSWSVSNNVLTLVTESGTYTLYASEGSYIGDYSSGPLTITGNKQYLSYLGETYQLKSSVSSYTTTGTTATTWETDKDNLVLCSLSFTRNVSNISGQSLIGYCSDLADLRSITSPKDGDRIRVSSRVNSYAAMEFGIPWGGGDFIYCKSLTGSQYADNGGSIIKPSNSNYSGSWVRSELVEGRSNIIDSVWFLDYPPSFLDDASDNIQAALDAAALWAVSDDLILNSNNAGPNGGLMVCKMPPRTKLTKTITCDISRVRIDGNRGIAVFSPSGSYTQYSNTNLPSDVGGGTVYGAVMLKSTAYGSRDEWPVYRDMLLVKDWTVSLQDLTTDYYTMSGTTSDNGIFAFVHYGDTSDNQTAYTAQAQFQNVNVHYFGGGYVNGDYAWGMSFINCKWVSNYWQQVFITGSDNSERMEFFDNVWQNGVNGIYVYKFQAGVTINGGSLDWMSGICFKTVDFNHVFMVRLNHWELPSTTAQMFVSTWSAVPYGGNYTNVTQFCVEGVTIIIAPGSTSTATKYYVDIESGFAVFSMRDCNMFYSGIDATPNFVFFNPNTKHTIDWSNVVLRGGIPSQFLRDWRFKATWTNPYVLGSTYCTAGGDTGAPAAMNAVWNSSGTLTLTAASTFSGAYYMQIRVPMVKVNPNWMYIYPYLNVAASSLTTPANWKVTWSYNTSRTTYPRAASSLSSLSLSSYGSLTANKELYPITSSSRAYYRNRYENLQNYQNIPSPDEVYIIVSVANGFTAGDTITIGDGGVYLA